MSAAALTRGQPVTRRDDGLQPTNLARDLYQIAELIELCFGSRLDANGTAAVREMKLVARLGPLLQLAALLDRSGMALGSGYVWRVAGRVVGNVSLYRGDTHPRLGEGCLIANVAVHPDHRRQGMARALMHAGLDLARRESRRWVVLQVQTDNEAALALYDDLGFSHYETLDQWQTTRAAISPSPEERLDWPVRLRRRRDISAEADLIYNRARLGSMAWTRPIARTDIYGSLLSTWLRTGTREHWVLPAPSDPVRLSGALWVEASGSSPVRLSLFLDPGLHDPYARQALLRWVLDRPSLLNRVLRVETVADDSPVEEFLHKANFRKVRSLIQMRKVLDSHW